MFTVEQRETLFCPLQPDMILLFISSWGHCEKAGFEPGTTIYPPPPELGTFYGPYRDHQSRQL